MLSVYFAKQNKKQGGKKWSSARKNDPYEIVFCIFHRRFRSRDLKGKTQFGDPD